MFPFSQAIGGAASLWDIERRKKEQEAALAGLPVSESGNIPKPPMRSGPSLDELEMRRRLINDAPPSFQPQQRNTAEMAGPAGVSQPIAPNPGLRPRAGISRFLLGDPQAPPQGNTANEQLQDILRRGTGREGFLRGLGNMIVPGAMRAFTDTYDEKVDRAAMAAEAENRTRQLDNQRAYQDAMRDQAQVNADRHMYRADAGVEQARIRAESQGYVALQRLIGQGMKFDIQPITEAQAPSMEAQGFNIVRDPQGNILAYRNAKDAAVNNAAGQVAVTETRNDGQAAVAEANNKTKERIADKANATRLSAATMGQNRNQLRDQARQLANSVIAEAADEADAKARLQSKASAFGMDQAMVNEALGTILQYYKKGTSKGGGLAADLKAMMSGSGGAGGLTPKPSAAPQRPGIGSTVIDKRDGRRKRIAGILPNGEPDLQEIIGGN